MDFLKRKSRICYSHTANMNQHYHTIACRIQESFTSVKYSFRMFYNNIFLISLLSDNSFVKSVISSSISNLKSQMRNTSGENDASFQDNSGKQDHLGFIPGFTLTKASATWVNLRLKPDTDKGRSSANER